MTTKTQTCPRRMNEWGPWEKAEGLDRWEVRGRRGLGHGTCNFCGSLHPDDFMAAIEGGAVVGPTDKSYKAYLDAAPTDEDRANALARAEGERARARSLGTYDDHQEVHIAAGVQFVHGGSIGKFYYAHLSEDQMRRFVDLYNDRTMQVGYPGHFYVSPFFMCPREGATP